MDDLTRYLQQEYSDAEYRCYQIATQRDAVLWRRIAMALAFSRSRFERISADFSGSLRRSKILRWEVLQPSNLCCFSGVLWLTKTADPKDYLIQAGESLLLTPGHWVIQALGASRVQLKPNIVYKEVPHGEKAVLSLLQRV